MPKKCLDFTDNCVSYLPFLTRFTAAAGHVVGLIGTLTCSGFWAAFPAIVVAVTYRDLLVVKEGVDIEQIAVVFD